MPQRLVGRARRKRRIRKKVQGSEERPRLTVFRSHRHFYAQVIDDRLGTTLTAASSLKIEMPEAAIAAGDAAKESGSEVAKEQRDKGKKKEKAVLTVKARVAEGVGKIIAAACLEKGIKQVVFDRNGYLYHGRVRAFADGVRKGGVRF
ncbi:MAG: 50S ribosomal protein L18 [Deltaproteobacteria bacterium]|nr:50S ribosomal protein L18 [Deltaproteobacteria bacterium]